MLGIDSLLLRSWISHLYIRKRSYLTLNLVLHVNLMLIGHRLSDLKQTKLYKQNCTIMVVLLALFDDSGFLMILDVSTIKTSVLLKGCFSNKERSVKMNVTNTLVILQYCFQSSLFKS